VLGAHPEGGEVQVMPGRYGPYVKWAKVNATLPKELQPETVTLEEALGLIAEKAGKGGKAKAAAKPKAAKPKAATPKAAAKPKAATPKADKPKAAKPKAAAKPKPKAGG
jgi:DNA topoisomerase-1